LIFLPLFVMCKASMSSTCPIAFYLSSNCLANMELLLLLLLLNANKYSSYLFKIYTVFVLCIYEHSLETEAGRCNSSIFVCSCISRQQI
jgi:hypothetical protein